MFGDMGLSPSKRNRPKPWFLQLTRLRRVGKQRVTWEYQVMGFEGLPIGSIVVPFWDYLLGFYI